VLHFNIDFWKARQCDQKQLDPYKAAFWRASGVDQALHQFTYIAMIWAWTVFAV